MALRRYWRKLTDYEFEVDWSAISFAAVGDVFRSLLEDLAGLPPRPDTLHNHRFPWWHPSHVNVNHFYIYSQSHQSSSFLIRGIIYDMGALIIPQSPKPYTKNGNIGLDERKDWSNVVHGYSMEQKNVDVFKADATEVLDRLGLKDVVGLKEKIDSGKQVNMRQLKLAKKQELEEIMGKGDSIRVKYMDRIMQKKMAAEARREQAKLGSVPTTLPPKDGSGLHAMPGSPALVRYLQERGLAQALLAHGTEDDLRMLLDQLGNFPFEDLKYIQSMKENAVPGEALSEEMLNSICTKWGLSPKQVLVVVGAGNEGDSVCKIVSDRGYFVCRVRNNLEDSLEGSKSSQLIATSSHLERGGIVSWFNKLSEGTLHLEDNCMPAVNRENVHFTVMDMTELKWVVEDLNGVSYRTTTFIRGFA